MTKKGLTDDASNLYMKVSSDFIMIAYKTFCISHQNADDLTDEMNRFLAVHRILKVEHIYDAGCWVFLVEYSPNKKNDNNPNDSDKKLIDYQKFLSPEEFHIYLRLRDIRKAIGEREGVAMFTIATNEQLAKIASLKEYTKAALHGISGFGEARVKKYGDELLKVFEDSGKSE